MSDRRPSDDEVDRLLRETFADDLPAELDDPLRREARRAWRRAASDPRRMGWPAWLAIPDAWRPLLPQGALVATALAMLGAGAVMQAGPVPPEVVESFRGHQASGRAAQALGRATAMACAVEATYEHGRRLSYQVDWRAPGEARVRVDGAAEKNVRLPGTRPSVLTRAAGERDGAPRDPALGPIRPFLSPAALGERLAGPWRPAPAGAVPGSEVFVVGPHPAAPGLTVTVDSTTHLPLRLDAIDRDGRTQAAVCRWP